MPDLKITPHAIQRYRQRVKDIPEAEIVAQLSTRAFEAAKDFARCAVILPTGHRAVMRWGAVITVLPHGVHAIFASQAKQRNA